MILINAVLALLIATLCMTYIFMWRSWLVYRVMIRRTDFVYQHHMAVIKQGNAPQGYKYEYPDVVNLHDKFLFDLSKWKYEQFFPD